MDKSFISSEGIKIGMHYNDIKKSTKNSLILERGWAYTLPLNSGWCAAFEISNYDLPTISNDSTVKWMYKRK
jgi:hypothetical protein